MVIVKITFVWVVSTAISCPVLVSGFSDYTNVYIDGDCTPRIRNFVLYGSVFAFYVPLLTILLTHGLTVRILRRSHSAMLRYVDGKHPTERATATRSGTDEPHTIILDKLSLIEDEMDECLICRSPGGAPFVDDSERHSVLPSATYTEHVPPVYSGPLQCAVCLSFVGKKHSSRSHIIKSACLGKRATSDNYILSNCCISNNVDSANITLRDTMISYSARGVVPVSDRNNSCTRCLAKETMQNASFDGSGKTTDRCIIPTNHPAKFCVSHRRSGSTNMPRPDHIHISSNNRFADSDCPSPCNQYNTSPRHRHDTMSSPTAAPLCGTNRLIRFLRRERAAHWRKLGCVHRGEKKRDSVYIPRRKLTNERKASKVLGIIVAVFLVLWTPFFVMNILSVVCPLCMTAMADSMSSSIVWLGYLSSLANPVIYTMFNTAFRQAFYRILTCQYRRQSAVYYNNNKTAGSMCLSNSTRQQSQQRALSRQDV